MTLASPSAEPFATWRMALADSSMLLTARTMKVSLQSAPSIRQSPAPVSEDDTASRGVLGFDIGPLQSSRVDSDVWNVPQPLPERGDRGIWSLGQTSLTWFPWIPSRQQIESLKVAELKAVCSERGLPKTGNKSQLRERIWDWTKERRAQQIRQNLKMGSSLNLFQAYQVQRKGSTDPRLEPVEQTSPSKTANSLAEWTRTIDLEPLLSRREAIHREKQFGKAKPKGKTPKRQTPNEYREVLQKAFTKPTSPYSNLDVKMIYAACKQADKHGDRKMTKDLLMVLKEATPNDARIYRRLARLEVEDGNASGARSILQEGLRLHPNNAYLWHGLGQIAATEPGAKQCYQRAIAIDPSFPNAYHALGTMEHSQGRVANAMKTLKKGVEACPMNHRLHHALGDLYRDAKMLPMAEKSYRKSLSLGSHVNHGFAMAGLAYVAYEQGNIEECRSWLRSAIELNDGRFANGWMALATMEESVGNTEAARLTCTTAIASYERDLLSRNRERVTVSLNEDNESLRHLSPTELKEKLIEQVPVIRSGDQWYKVYRTWTRLEQLYGSHESTELAFQRAALVFPNEYRISLDWATHLLAAGFHEKARVLFARACEQVTGKHGDPYRKFAAFEMSRGNFDMARRILFRGATDLAQSSDIGSPGKPRGMAELLHTWAVCEWHLGNTMRAEKLIDDALRQTASGQEGSKLRSFILYSLARLEHDLGEHILAQHCIGLCLAESQNCGSSKIWELWSKVALALENHELAEQCSTQASIARDHEQSGGSDRLSRMLKSTKPSELIGADMKSQMRRCPWEVETLGSRDALDSLLDDSHFPDSM